ncbi:MAG TPA: LuxR C-terminal-related transcriptional regulator [Kofleriaceae bacterium]|nr:LuxR C-terminal-related transcriptional regulator [Kofleriaceae bacterium]
MLEGLDRGRELYRQRAWADAYELLSPLEPELGGDDLELLAIAAYMLGRDDTSIRVFERAHHVHVEAKQPTRAGRCAFWVALQVLLRGEPARANGWLTRGQRVIADLDCAARGYLQIPMAEQRLRAGDPTRARAMAAAAAEIGARLHDPDLAVCARHVEARSLLALEDLDGGLGLLDEVMIAVIGGELSPIMTGLVYCSVIDACQDRYEVARAREWTIALAAWCAKQPQLVSFTSTCLAHRAEILHLDGAWTEALDEARGACARFASGLDRRPPAGAYYQQGEIYRLRGELDAAEHAYRTASEWGFDPQPGMALLRLAQGQSEVARAMLDRVLTATAAPLRRMRLLPARVEIALAHGALDEARAAADELAAGVGACRNEVLAATAAQLHGAVALAEGRPRDALAVLRDALATWQRLAAPYAAARTRELLASACAGVGDREGQRLDLEGARATYRRLGARPDVARVDTALAEVRRSASPVLSARELQVLGMVTSGKTNRRIAAELRLSEKTIDRHVSNIFTKLHVSSRAAAAAYAVRHKLV